MAKTTKARKTMICVRGTHNYGKSSTIAETYNCMTGKSRKKEFCDTCTYKGHKITVQTAGDIVACFNTLGKEIAKKDPDFVVCATRMKGKTIQAAKKMAKKGGFEMIWVSPNYNPSKNFDIDEMNRNCGDSIKSIVDDIISGRY